MNEPKYKINQKLWTILDCDPVSCVVIKTGRNIVKEPEYLVQPDVHAGHFKQEYWTAEDRLYDNELDAVEEAARLWENKHKKAVEEADYILSRKLAYLKMREAELQEQYDLSGKTLTSGYYEIKANQTFSYTMIRGLAKVGIMGGTLEQPDVTDGGTVHMTAGLLESAVIIKRGKVVVDGGHVFSASISEGGSLCVSGCSSCTPYVEHAVLNDGADASLCSAIGSGIWVRSSCELALAAGAVASDTLIGYCGNVGIHSGASMVSCTICSGGTLTMYGSGVEVNDLTIRFGGIVRYMEENK